MKKFLAVDVNLYGEKFKFYNSMEEARNDKDFLYDAIFELVTRERELMIFEEEQNAKI